MCVQSNSVYCFGSVYIHELPQLPRLQTAIYHTGLDVKNESHPVHVHVYTYICRIATPQVEDVFRSQE